MFIKQFRSPFLRNLILSYLAIVIVTILVSDLAISRNLEAFLRQDVEEKLREDCVFVREFITSFIVYSQTSNIQEHLRKLREDSDTRITVILADGKVIADNYENPSEMQNHRDRPEFRQAETDGIGTSTRHSKTVGMELTYVAVPIRFDDVIIGYVRSSIPLNKIGEQLAGLRHRLIISGIAALAIGLGLALFFARRLTKVIIENVNVIASSSAEIAATIEQQECSASAQAAAVNETTVTMDELSVSFQQITRQSTEVSQRATESLQLIKTGNQSVNDTLKGMELLKEKVTAIAEQILHLSAQSSQIGDITSVVRELAGQTNLLALNAAVEAARAGEHGKGFAVVSAEIRKLADESKKSAERINMLIGDIRKATDSTVMATEEGTKTVDIGMERTRDVIVAFNSLNDSFNLVYESVQQNALNVTQQTGALEQMVTAMSSINAGVQQSQAGTVQTREALIRVNSIAQKLKDMV